MYSKPLFMDLHMLIYFTNSPEKKNQNSIESTLYNVLIIVITLDCASMDLKSRFFCLLIAQLL